MSPDELIATAMLLGVEFELCGNKWRALYTTVDGKQLTTLTWPVRHRAAYWALGQSGERDKLSLEQMI